MDIPELKRKAKILEPVVRIGKSGLTEGIIVEINRHLRKRKLVKAKILNNCGEDSDRLIEKVLEKTSSALVSRVGKVFVVYRERN